MSHCLEPSPDRLPAALNEYRLLGRSGLRVSPLCLGAMTFGTEWGWGADRDTCRAMFDRYAEQGGNFIDTADFYTEGTSERMIGDFTKADRAHFIIGTKYSLKTRDGDPNQAGNHRANMVRSVEASLKRLETDYIDLYWLHAWDFTTPVDEVMRGLDDLVRSGKVIYIAISDTPAWKIAQLNTFAECNVLSRFIATQGHYNLIKRDVERDILPACRELGVGVMPWAPLGGGVLTGKYGRDDLEREKKLLESGQAKPFGEKNRFVGLTEQKLHVAGVVRDVAEEIGATPSQVALRWLLTRRGVTSVILGVRSVKQLDDNVGCLSITLSESHLDRLDEASRFSPGFPHDFLASDFVRRMVTGDAAVLD